MDPALGVTRLVIDRDQALRIGRLHESPQARAFIESFDEHGVDLPRACGTYDEALRGFASRFRAAIEGEHADALRSYQELEARHRAAQAIAYPDDD